MKDIQNSYDIRRKMIDKINSYSGKDLIHMPIDYLDYLLFEKIDTKHGLIKIPVFSGKFLRKIDLSEVDFEDVSWFLLSPYLDSSSYTFDSFKQKPRFLEIKRLYQGKVDFSHTNANIDLDKSFETKNENILYLDNVDLENTNTYNNPEKIVAVSIGNSNLKDTHVKLPNTNYVYYQNNNFTNLDLSNITIDGNKFIEGNNQHFNECNLTNTKMNINFDQDRYFDSITGDNGLVTHYNLYKAYNYNWNGCYVNGKLFGKKPNKIIK